jgi:hypothetical protein
LPALLVPDRIIGDAGAAWRRIKKAAHPAPLFMRACWSGPRHADQCDCELRRRRTVVDRRGWRRRNNSLKRQGYRTGGLADNSWYWIVWNFWHLSMLL